MEPGARIGKYVIESSLGEGGNGAVYLARDGVLGRAVAIKVLHPHLVYDATVAARFRQEAQAMAQLNHPNVVIVHDFVASELAGQPQWAIVMELVEGGQTLGALVRREGPLQPLRAARLIAQVAGALGYAHARGIVHRDVKPANVMVVRQGGMEIAKITDFGIARVMHGERRTQAALTLGTIWYLAPEQAQSSSVDARADVYSLGVTFFEALTGRVPFPYDNVARALAAHVSEVAPAPSSVVAGVHPLLDEVVARCLAKAPAARPANGEEVRSMLEQALSVIDPSPGSLRPPPISPSAQTVLAQHTPGPSPGHTPGPAPGAQSHTPGPALGYTPGPAPHSPQLAGPHSPRAVVSTTPMTPMTPGAVTPSGAVVQQPFPSAAPGAPPSLAPQPQGGSGISSGEKQIGMWIGIGALIFVVAVCLLGGVLCTIAVSVR